MPSRNGSPLRWLLRKEWRVLTASHAFWLMLLVVGLLVGVSFTSAVRTYVELSTYGGGGEAFAPLVGVWAPTFSACELAAAFLLPFVAIRVVAGDRQSGALKLELQHPLPVAWRIGAKGLVLLTAWAVATLPALVAVALWRGAGGSVFLPELGAVLLGHMLNGALSIALASAAASLTEHPSTAAIVTLSVTAGTWVLSFVAAVEGGVVERMAAFTPAAMVAEFQHGLVRFDVVAIGAILVALGLTIAAIWTRLGIAARRRAIESAAAAAVAVILVAGAARVNASADLSESRMNSFPRGVEQTLSHIETPLRITAHLAPEDPRRTELERKTFSKLRRALPGVTVTYTSHTTTGLFEQNDERYGEIEYELGDKRAVSYKTTTEGVLETVYGLALVDAPGETDEYDFRGHGLRAPPANSSAVFFGVWPAVILTAALLYRRRGS